MVKNLEAAFAIEKRNFILYVKKKPVERKPIQNSFQNAEHTLERHRFFPIIKTKFVLKTNIVYVMTFLITTASEYKLLCVVH